MAIARTNKTQNRILTTERTNEAMASNLTYTASSDGGALRRIRTPSPHDVLSGRGGNVNAHPGNHQFREWVKVRREDYSLAFSKEEKAIICREVIALVEKLGGRFLVKESTSSQWWIELDDERVMAKTSQALREGAPQIRASHHEEIAEMMEARHQRPRKPNNKKRDLAQTANSNNSRIVSEKRSRFESDGVVLPSTEDAFPHSTAPQNDNELMPAPSVVSSMPLPMSLSPLRTLKRQNSLVLSEFGDVSMDIEFVNPFADESELLGRKGGAPALPLGSLPGTMEPPKPVTIWRQSSNSSDMGGLGALFRSTDSVKSNATIGSLPSLGSFLRESSFNNLTGALNAQIEPLGHRNSISSSMRSRYAADKDDDAFSIASEGTLDLPLWEWFNRDDISSSQQIPVSF